jgi:hypothetical protein
MEDLMENGPPPRDTMLELVPDYEYRAWIEGAGLLAVIFVLPQERRILIESVS